MATGITDASSRIDALTGLAIPDGITLLHLQPRIGTEVQGLDLRDPLGPDHVAFLRALWLARKVIFFRDQPLTEEQHIAFGRHFGPLDALPTEPGMPPPPYPELLVIDRDGSDDTGSEAFFHQDIPYANPPVAGSVALLRRCPQVGGDTIFADMAAAYEGLSPWLKRAIAGLRAEHRFDEGIRFYNRAVTQDLIDRFMVKYPPKTYPVVLTHAETGARILYVSLAYTSRILDLPRAESAALIKLLSDQACVPEYQCRFRWSENAIAIWDNRAVQHYACFDYPGQRRQLHRLTILDTVPWPETDVGQEGG